MAKKRAKGKIHGGRQRGWDARLAFIRWGILGVAAAIAGTVLTWGLLYGIGGPAGIQEGSHYQVVADPPRRRAGDPIIVTEFFSYGCIHCQRFDPLIEDWRKTLAEGVVFERVPVAFSPQWAILGQAYWALEQTGALARNHERFFRAIHDNGRQFRNVEQVADFVDGNGITREAFLEAYNSPKAKRALARGEARQRALGIPSVPSLAVADKYVVNMDVGRRLSLKVVDHLLKLELGGEGAQGEGVEGRSAEVED